MDHRFMCFSKHMTSHKAIFDMYKVITSRNVYLGDNIVVQAIRMRSIVVESTLECKINQIHIKDVLHLPKLYCQFALSEQTCVK